MSTDAFDAVVIGAGPGGRGCAKRLNAAGMRVAMLERELVGGECPFWACIPSKTLLRPVEVVWEARHSAGLTAPAPRWSEISEYRDYMNSGLDDAKKFASYADLGIEIIRGRGRILGRGVIEVDGRRLETERIIVATGTDTAVPDVDGISEVEFWTNREATSFHEIPASTIVLGGGPVGVELGQMLARYGSRVSIVEAADRLVAREHPAVGRLLEEQLRAEGLEILTGDSAERVEEADGGVRIHLKSGARLAAERLLVAAGRRARVDDLGLDAAGVDHDSRGIRIDDRCRAAPGVWAVGDVTGVAQFTHVAAYQAKIAAADILGRDTRADYRAIPRVVFSDPEVAGVGLTPELARDAGLEFVEARVDLSEVDRTETYGRDLRGEIGVLADAREKVLVGAWAVGPMAGEWIHGAVVAIKARVPVAVLADTIAQFPTFSEGVLTAIERLDLA